MAEDDIAVCIGYASKRLSLTLGLQLDDVSKIHTMSEIGECTKDWLLKSTTSFYGYEGFSLPWYFGLFCLNFSLGGIVMLLLRPKWAKTSKFPYYADALILIFVQGPLSFTADFLNMVTISPYHMIDKFCALPLVGLEITKIITMFQNGHRMASILTGIAFSFAIFCHTQSSSSQTVQDLNGFIFWHNMWHLYPIFASFIQALDFFVLDKYDSSIKIGKKEN